MRQLPVLIISTYQRIPWRLRDAAFTCTGASTRALADIAAGASPWRALWQHGGLRPGPHFVSAAWKGEGGGPHP